MSIVGYQGQGVVIEAVIWPACECGEPYGTHIPPAVNCAGYRPVRAVEHLGTRAYRPPRGYPLWKRIACATIWAVEVRLQGWREALARQ
jgi:hypothetical protein